MLRLAMSDAAALGLRFTVRRGPPWPLVRCEHCGGSRHYPRPETAAEESELEADMLNFALAHRGCPWIVARASSKGPRADV